MFGAHFSVPSVVLAARHLRSCCYVAKPWRANLAWIIALGLIVGAPKVSGWTAELSRTSEVGPVKATVTLSPSEPTIGDEVELEIKVEAAKDVEVLMPEFGEALERYSILDFVPRQIIDSNGNIALSQKYTLQPHLSGEQAIPPILIEFIDNRPGSRPSPDDFDAYELLTERLDFNVKSVVVDSAANELKPPLGELELHSSVAAQFRWLIIAATLGLFLAIAVGLVWASRLRTRILKRNAYELARQKIDRLVTDRRSASPQLTMEQFYVGISAVIRQYLENRFDLRAPELTTDEFLQLASAQSELSKEHQQLLAEFLNQADLVKFSGGYAAGHVNEQDVRRSCELAVRFLEETRTNAPDIVISAEDDGSAQGGAVAATRTAEDSVRV